VLPEAHQVVPERPGPLPTWINIIAHRWRHSGTLLWLDTQNPADVKKEIFRACGELYVFNVGGWQDYDTLRRIGGPSLEEASRRLSALADARGPGWHLRVAVGVTPKEWVAYRVGHGGKLDRVPLTGASVVARER
jgi:hypothetical protein